MQDLLYEFLLDLFPLTDEIISVNSVLSEKIQQEAIELLLSGEGALTLVALERMRLLLQLATDLGYVGEEVHCYLRKNLRRVADTLRTE
jgi:hypothetical protein